MYIKYTNLLKIFNSLIFLYGIIKSDNQFSGNCTKDFLDTTLLIMGGNMKKTIRLNELKSIIAVILGLVFISTVLVAYWGDFQHAYELTFLSNTSTGLFLLTTFMLEKKGKALPQILYLDFALLLFMVFLICISFISEFNFNGATFFLHVINPLILMVYFFIFIDMNKINNVMHVLTILIMPITYLVFAVIFGSITGNYIYFFLDYKEKGIAYSVIFILVVAVSLVVIGYGIFFLNRFLHKRIEKNKYE